MSDSPSIWYHTFGCKANQYDTERMRQELEGRGADTVADARDADVVVLNTCTVTNQADANARQLIRRLRRERPDLRIVVAGCSTAIRESDYRDMPETDGVVPGQDPALVVAALSDLGLIPDESSSTGPLRRNARGTRGWLKIQDGCDRKCSFCATRVARGASVSRSVDDVVEEARLLARHHPELVITGIHIGHYGLDLDGGIPLSALCERLLDSVSVRLRLSSIEATEIDERLVALLRDSAGQLAPHLHVPLQSGSNVVLRHMRRWHTREAYRTRIFDIADAVYPLGLGADIIVGFPGETEEHHAETRALVEELPYTYLHVFPYSVRDRTAAASLPERVPGDVAAARSRELREIGVDKGIAYRRSRAGGEADLVVERSASDGGPAVALSGDYLRVDVRGDVAAGDRVVARLRAEGDRLVADVASAGARSAAS
ncbi:MAG: MiaB/RimO family radical SAM methylthiotransferase [Gemmatimonadota bacterium]